jgi:hypothetical protein
MSIQILQITPLMGILWPTCLNNFLSIMWVVNLQTNYFQNLFKVSADYPSVNTYFTNYGYQSRVFLFNNIDEVAFSAVFLALVPAFALCYKYVKV